MLNSLDYLNLRGDLTFDKDPINDIDLFLCSQLAAPDYKNIISTNVNEKTIKEISEEYFKNHTTDVSNLGVLQSSYVLPMLKEMASSARFKNVIISGYGNIIDMQEEEQFSAITIRISNNTYVVSFRGTDDTLIGWKEDFNLSIYDEVPAQRDAKRYLDSVSKKFLGKIYVVGHSKGGNLAVYAASNAKKSVQRRIVKVISFDGPGFNDSFFEKEGYKNLQDRIFTVISQNSIVGTLLQTAGKVEIVHSRVEGAMAHDGFNWEVKYNYFVNEDKLSDLSNHINKIMDETLSKLTFEEKKDFIDSLFDSLMSTGFETITDFKSNNYIDSAKVLVNVGSNKNVRNFAKSIIRTIEKYSVSKIKSEL